MDDYKGYCLDCKGYTTVALDHRTGDTICVDCGLVLDEHYIDVNSEWRNFCDNQDSDRDPNRVGARSNPLLTHGNLSTVITNAVGTKGDNFVSKKLNYRQSNPDKGLLRGFETIETMATRLGLVTVIKDRACEIYMKMDKKKACNEKNRNPMSAACLFIACRENKLPRTLKEVCNAGYGVTMKEINKAVQVIKRQVEVMDMGAINPSELVRRFCSNLGMKNHAIKAVHEAVENIKELDIRRNPKSVLAAIIYIISQLSAEKKPLGAISAAAEVAEGTIKKSYKDICPHASRLVPKWYAKEEDIKRLCIS